MKKIVIDARGYATSTGRYVRKLIENLELLEADQNEREYIVLLFPDEFEKYQPKNPRFSKKIANYPHYGFAEQIGFLFLLYKLRADLVHFTMPQQPVLYLKKHVTTMHDLTLIKVFPGNRNRVAYKIKQFVGVVVYKIIALTSAHVITPSRETKIEYLKLAGLARSNLTKKISVTHEAAEPANSRPLAFPSLVNKDFIMYVGQQSNYKNLRRLIQAHQQLLTTHPQLLLVFVGKLGEYGKQTKAWVEQQSYKNVVFTGFVESEAQLAWLYQNTRAYVFASLMEGFGLPPLEAMANGAPVVSSNASCIPEICGDAAHYFDPVDVEAMAKAISEVLDDNKLRSDLIKRGSKQLKKYSWQKMAKQTLAIYKSSL